MTQKQLSRIVLTWQHRLGLAAWDIQLNLTEPCSEDADATTWRSNTYERATLRVDTEWRSWSKLFTNIIVVHELLHFQTRDLDEAVKVGYEGPGAETIRCLERRYDHEIEGFVDRLAYRIVEIGGAVG